MECCRGMRPSSYWWSLERLDGGSGHAFTGKVSWGWAIPCPSMEMGWALGGQRENREVDCSFHRTVSQDQPCPDSLWRGMGVCGCSGVWPGAQCRHHWGPLHFAASQGRPTFSKECLKEFRVSIVEGFHCRLSQWGKVERWAWRGWPSQQLDLHWWVLASLEE